MVLCLRRLLRMPSLMYCKLQPQALKPQACSRDHNHDKYARSTDREREKIFNLCDRERLMSRQDF
jgi:hypothetical protein